MISWEIDSRAAAGREARRRSDRASVKPGYGWTMSSAVPVTRYGMNFWFPVERVATRCALFR